MSVIVLNQVESFCAALQGKSSWELNDMSKSEGCQSAAAAAESKQKWRAFLKQS